MKLIIIGVVLLLVFASAVAIYFYKHEQNIPSQIKLYQGPVPEGYDEDYFRETGITKPLEEN